MRKTLLLLLLTSALSAQTPKPPTIPDGVQAKFWKAQSQLKSAQEALQNAQKQSEEAIAEIQKACGTNFVPQLGPTGDPICAPKPESKPEAKK